MRFALRAPLPLDGAVGRSSLVSVPFDHLKEDVLPFPALPQSIGIGLPFQEK